MDSKSSGLLDAPQVGDWSADAKSVLAATLSATPDQYFKVAAGVDGYLQANKSKQR